MLFNFKYYLKYQKFTFNEKFLFSFIRNPYTVMCGVFLKYYVRYWFFHSALFVSQELIGNNSFQIITLIILLCDFLSDDLILCFILFYSCFLVISLIYIPEINVDVFLIRHEKQIKDMFVFICVKSCSSLASHSLIYVIWWSIGTGLLHEVGMKTVLCSIDK